MGWLEKFGYLLVIILFALFAAAFRYQVDDFISAEGVQIQAQSNLIEASQPTLVVASLVEDFEEVTEGQPLLQVVEGEESIRRYRVWSTLEEAKAAGQADLAGISIPKPEIKTLNAPSAGTFRLEQELGALVEEGVIAKVLDYSQLMVEANLKGTTIGSAAEGQQARLTALNMESDGNTIIRGTLLEGGAPVLTRNLAGDRVRSAIEESLSGSRVQLRDDIPLEIQKVSSVEIDTDLKAAKASEAAGAPLDPDASFVITGTVVEGEHMAEVQLARLPDETVKAAREALNAATKGASVTRPDGSEALQLEGAENPRFVVKATAARGEGKGQAPLSASSLSRSYSAKIRLDNPPPFLVQRLKDADRNGKKITAKVEVKTSSRPIAFVLLKRS